jgi:hypothetical protein
VFFLIEIILFANPTKTTSNNYFVLFLQLTGKMIFYGFLAMLPREDFPPSFIRPFEGILDRSF